MTEFHDRQSITLARLMAETYEAWVRRFCQEREIPWREEYAVPLDNPRDVPRPSVASCVPSNRNQEP